MSDLLRPLLMLGIGVLYALGIPLSVNPMSQPQEASSALIAAAVFALMEKSSLTIKRIVQGFFVITAVAVTIAATGVVANCDATLGWRNLTVITLVAAPMVVAFTIAHLLPLPALIVAVLSRRLPRSDKQRRHQLIVFIVIWLATILLAYKGFLTFGYRATAGNCVI